jgi:hypothetical protein
MNAWFNVVRASAYKVSNVYVQCATNSLKPSDVQGTVLSDLWKKHPALLTHIQEVINH